MTIHNNAGWILSSLCLFLLSNPAFAQTAPYASGSVEDLNWELRVNRSLCNHPDKPATWCDESDEANAIVASGIQDTLLTWINDPLTEFVSASYMTFTSPVLAEALCKAAADREIPVNIYLQSENIASLETATGVYKQLLECSRKNKDFHLWQRGTDDWLNHAKIFLAGTKAGNGKSQRVKFTSSSANLSTSGLGLHYDNWLLFDAPHDHYLAKQNLCFFQALDNMTMTDGRQNKGYFIQEIDTCWSRLKIPSKVSVRFLAVPSGSHMEKPLDTLLKSIDGAKKSIRIAAHKLTMTGSAKFPLVERLTARLRAGVRVTIIYDDDTVLSALRAPGFKSLNVSQPELRAYEELLKHGAEMSFVDTNEAKQLYMHNKFMIFDDQTVFAGAGNFSSASLLGTNTEQFYVLQDEAMVKAYAKSWNELHRWSYPVSYFKPLLRNGS